MQGKVFIVHGHDHGTRDKIDLFLTKELKLQTEVMDANPGRGRTLPQKFEELANECAFAVFILTADDVLINQDSNKEIKRARQNVILEVGYFWGLLGRRDRMAFLVDSNISQEDLPSDILGIETIEITGDLGETKRKLQKELKELEEAGLISKLVPVSSLEQGDEIGMKTVLPALEAGLENKEEDIRRLFEKELIDKGKQAVPELIKALDNEHEKVRVNAAWALGRIGDPTAVDKLIEALSSEYKEVCEYAAWSLGKIGNQKAIPKLIDALDKSKYEEVRRNAVWALGEIGENPKTIAKLENALKNDNPEICRYAAVALGKLSIPDKDTVKALIKVLENNKDKLVCESIIDALRIIGTSEALKAVKEYKKDDAPMVLIPAGEFEMGMGSAEIPRHTVYLNAFYIDKYEVTVGQYKKFIDSTDHPPPNWSRVSKYSPTDSHPIIFVSWNDAQEYCKWAGKRLPTEAEWEKAARDGLDRKRFPWGDEVPDGTQCNFADRNTDYSWSDKNVNDGYQYTAPVESFSTNRYELYNMAGNVWEWCADWYNEDYYSSSPRENPLGPSSGEYRVLRGGSWIEDLPKLRVAYRSGLPPDDTYNDVGFRCVKDIKP